MGVSGLLSAVSSAGVEVSLSSLSGKTAGVDIYSWIHKATFSCASSLVEDPSGPLPRSFLNFLVHRINLLRHFSITPILVFDGAELPLKAATDSQRAAKREEAKAEARKARASQNLAGAEMWSQKAVEVTIEMAAKVRKAMESGADGITGGSVSCITAPYEADAQLAAMALKGKLDFVITEDSDLIAYGAPSILYKMDKFGKGTLIQQAKLSTIPSLPLAQFTREMLVLVCVLSGCDFLPRGVPGLGIKKAHALVKKFRSFKRVLQVLRTHPKYGPLPATEMGLAYPEAIRRACLVFGHQTIYDEETKKLAPLRPLTTTVGRLIDEDPDGNPVEKEWDEPNRACSPSVTPPSHYSFLGPLFEPRVAEQIAIGRANPVTRVLFPTCAPAIRPLSQPSLSLPTRPKSMGGGSDQQKLSLSLPVSDALPASARRLSKGLSIPEHISRSAVAAGRTTSAPALSEFRPPRALSASPVAETLAPALDFLAQYSRSKRTAEETADAPRRPISKPKLVKRMNVAEMQQRNAAPSRLGLPLFQVGVKPPKQAALRTVLKPLQAKSIGSQTQLQFN